MVLVAAIVPVQAQSPYAIKWSTDGPLLALGTGALGVTALLGHQRAALTADEIAALDPVNINGFDRPAIRRYSSAQSNLSDLLVGSMMIVPAGLMVSDRIRGDVMTIGVMYAEVMVLANLGPQIFKVSTPRARPYVYNPGVPLSEKTTVNAKESFFSGHTSNAFASAVFVSGVYSAYYPDSRWSPYVWAGSLTLAAVVGYLRFSSGKHFPTDVLTGAVWGSAVGFLVPHLHRTDHPENMIWNPLIGDDRIGGHISFKF